MEKTRKVAKVIYNNHLAHLPVCVLVDENGQLLEQCSQCDTEEEVLKDDYKTGCLFPKATDMKVADKEADIPLVVRMPQKEKSSKKKETKVPINLEIPKALKRKKKQGFNDFKGLFWMVIGVLFFMTGFWVQSNMPTIVPSSRITSMDQEISALKKDFAEMSAQIEELKAEIAVLQERIAEMSEVLPSLTVSASGYVAPVPATTELQELLNVPEAYVGKIKIAYFKQYYQHIDTTSSAKVFNSRNTINVIDLGDNLFINHHFVRNSKAKYAELKLEQDGVIYYRGCSQYEAEMIMQRLLESAQAKAKGGAR